MERPNAWKTYTKKDLEKLEVLNKDYMDFLDKGKTERECVKRAIELAKESGYKDLKEIIKKDKKNITIKGSPSIERHIPSAKRYVAF